MKPIIGRVRAELYHPTTKKHLATAYVERDAAGPRQHTVRFFGTNGRKAEFVVDGRSLRFSNGLIHLFAAAFFAAEQSKGGAA